MEGDTPEGKATVATLADATGLRELAAAQAVTKPFSILLSDAVPTSPEMDSDGPLADAGGEWRWIRVRGPAGEPGLRRVRA
eukprot:13943501-Alexandrium_andersonii.AAC.1